MLSVKQQLLRPRIKTRVIFIKEAFISTHLIGASARIWSCVEAAYIVPNLFFHNMRNLHLKHAGYLPIFVGFCSGEKKQRKEKTDRELFHIPKVLCDLTERTNKPKYICN